jgi:hypothetical protein
LLTFGKPPPGAPGPKNTSGSVVFTLKDGLLSKIVVKLKGTVNFGGEDTDLEGKTTIDIKDVGTTKIEIPEAAKKKL